MKRDVKDVYCQPVEIFLRESSKQEEGNRNLLLAVIYKASEYSAGSGLSLGFERYFAMKQQQ